MARSPDGNSFHPSPTHNISKVVKLTHSWPMHLGIIHLTFCNPGYVKDYVINLFMARAPDDHSFNPLPIKNISKFIKLTHSWSEHPNLYIKFFATLNFLRLISSTHSWPEHLSIHLSLCHPPLFKDYFSILLTIG